MKHTNGSKSRIQFTLPEIEAIYTLVRDRLRAEVGSTGVDESLGGVLAKVARASKKLKPLG